MNIFLDSSSIWRLGKCQWQRFKHGLPYFCPASSYCRSYITKQARRRICRENLSKMWPPSETTRRHRKEVRVTDLARPSIYLLFRDDVVVYVGQSINPYARMSHT